MGNIRTTSVIKMPDLSKIQDKSTRDALEQIVRFLFDNQFNIHDDLNKTQNLSEYASNALAIAAGLEIGDFYRNGDNVCVVH